MEQVLGSGRLSGWVMAKAGGHGPGRDGSADAGAGLGRGLEVISFGYLGRLWGVVGIVERLVPDELWELFQ
ncbi:hypothetical protein ABZX78_33145, partial [Streptomyces cellulosae]